LHHTLGDYQIPRWIYEHVTAASTHLVDGETAPAEIDRVLTACLVHQQPVYISLPTDVVGMPCTPPLPFVLPEPAPSDPAALDEAVAVTRIGRANFKETNIDDLASYFKGKTIRVTRIVILKENLPAIEVDDPRQIEVVEKTK
jgi:TPP-dependent 2-oxoacid decarboxylase